MILSVLGSGAGGGSPQWNCACPTCQAVRRGEAPPRTQTSVAVSRDGRQWALLNASPDLRSQIAATPALQPQRPGRHSPIASVVLTGAEIDQVVGLLHMREGHPFSLYGSSTTLAALARSPIFDALPADRVPRRPLPPATPTALLDTRDEPLDLDIELFAVPGKVPLYEENLDVEPDLLDESGTTAALKISDGSSTVFFIPGCAAITDDLKARLHNADLLFFDGTLFRDDELVTQGLSHKTGRRMGHLSIDGPDGTMALLKDLPIPRKIFLHMNNSNPVLLPDSPERARVLDQGWEIAHDGMQIQI